ncbi:hypothetical protein D3C73_1487610 [compost metagenome]
MFFLYLIDGPTLRAVKLYDKASTVFVLELVDTVFIAVERGKPGIHPDPLLKQRIHDGIRV